MNFLGFLRKRFESKQTADFWRLDDKECAYAHVRGLGYSAPFAHRFDSARAAFDFGVEEYGNQFVVKAGDRHSCIGVYLIKKISGNRYINLLDLSEVSRHQIGFDLPGKAPSFWLVESFVESYVRGRDIPLDYKFYCFGKNVALIIQIDRNVSPARVAIFDGSFVPLRYGEDYFFDETRWMPSGHVVPFNAPEMILMASKLSESTGTNFVSVDCFDSKDGPVFGEFTFAPGAPDSGMVTFSERVLGILDQAVSGAAFSSASGFDIDYVSMESALNSERVACQEDLDVFGFRVARMLDRDRLSARGLSFISSKLGSHFEFIFKYIGFLNGDGEQAFTLASRISSGSGLFSSAKGGLVFASAALEFYCERIGRGPWFETRFHQVKLAYFPQDSDGSLERISEIADEGYEYAKRVFSTY
ncbi:ATP-grasp fold amidoligase family protein [Microbulbifer sp. YPW1]|uniref:ATP-grasp fold amidoligase family protein n=1 Tax=Microbulbifer sp. YPW1 TaxID=2745199 RepID=UPI0015978312|nr:ATP-grasp fold amidoligase family protein [Microbulbifer sp. YPW1]QKX15830.1 hypothetical protein HUW35_01765 [Microbulbifer sp. YPW1]